MSFFQLEAYLHERIPDSYNRAVYCVIPSLKVYLFIRIILNQNLKFKVI